MIKPNENLREILAYTAVGILSTVIQFIVYSAVYYVFKVQAGTKWWAVLLKTYAVFFATGVIGTNLLSALFIDVIKISPYLSPILIVVILYPTNYLINKKWGCATTEERKHT